MLNALSQSYANCGRALLLVRLIAVAEPASASEALWTQWAHTLRFCLGVRARLATTAHAQKTRERGRERPPTTSITGLFVEPGLARLERARRARDLF